MFDVSIIIPIYNAENNLRKCIDSAVNQKNIDKEVILVNDGSRDNSGRICDEYTQRYSFVKVIHTPNLGVSTARNTGMKFSESEYIIFLDSDDELELNMASKILNYSRENQLDFAMGSYKKMYLNNGTVYRVSNVLCDKFTGNIKEFLSRIDNYLFKPLLQGPCWKLFKTDIINEHKLEFPENMTYGEDACFVYDYLQYVKKAGTLPDILYRYNRHNKIESLSSTYRYDKLEINVFLITKLIKLFDLHNVDKKNTVSTLILNYYISYLDEVYKNKELFSKNDVIAIIEKSNKLVVPILDRNSYKGKKLYKKIINFLIKKKKNILLYYLFIIKNIIKKVI